MASPTIPDTSESYAGGTVVAGKYRLRRLLARGGSGSVFEAERIADGALFALKRMDHASTGDEVSMNRFAREVRAANTVQSEHIAVVLDVGTDAGCPFLLMELLQGEDLGARLQRVKRLSWGEAVNVTWQILVGLTFAHAAGVVHRDLKPENVFLTERPEGPPCVKILDFGVSKIQPKGTTTPLALTLKGATVGTPLYMSPEQATARPDVDERSDIYSVGAILFECLTGRPPHVGESNEAILQSIRTNHAPPVQGVARELPTAIAEVVDRALAFERGARFASADEMRLALEASMAGDEGRQAEGERASRPIWLAAVVALVIGVLSVVGIAWLLGSAGGR